MKEASGELNMTVITIIAIVAVGALFAIFIWPMIERQIVEQTCQTYGADYHAQTNESAPDGGIGSVDARAWVCVSNSGGQTINPNGSKS